MINLALLREQLSSLSLTNSIVGVAFVTGVHVAEYATFVAKDDGFVRLDWDTTPIQGDLDIVVPVISGHNPTDLSSTEQNTVDRADAHARFLLSQLHNKTPEQIYTYLENRIDAWTSLADAQTDLKDWLPLLCVLVAVKE